MSLLLALAACGTVSRKEISGTKPYADLIGTTYRVVADDLQAYGIYESLNNRIVTYVTLIPGVGIGGPEVAFRQPIPKGSELAILSAWTQTIWFDNPVYYVVAVPNVDLPRDVPVQIELFRGNEGAGVDLNPRIYSKLPKDQ
jgi:hypothetical protein